MGSDPVSGFGLKDKRTRSPCKPFTGFDPVHSVQLAPRDSASRPAIFCLCLLTPIVSNEPCHDPRVRPAYWMPLVRMPRDGRSVPAKIPIRILDMELWLTQPSTTLAVSISEDPTEFVDMSATDLMTNPVAVAAAEDAFRPLAQGNEGKVTARRLEVDGDLLYYTVDVRHRHKAGPVLAYDVTVPAAGETDIGNQMGHGM
jgi:hypothetical protein